MEEQMKKSLICLVAFLSLLVFAAALLAAPSPKELHGGVYGNGSHAFSLATGSPGQLGLVKALAERFPKIPFSPDHETTGRHSILLMEKHQSALLPANTF